MLNYVLNINCALMTYLSNASIFRFHNIVNKGDERTFNFKADLTACFSCLYSTQVLDRVNRGRGHGPGSRSGGWVLVDENLMRGPAEILCLI